MNRRNFLGLLGLTGAATVPVVANASEPKKPPKMSENDLFQPHITLGNLKTNSKVDLAVGEDNQLWIRPKGSDWKRLKVE